MRPSNHNFTAADFEAYEYSRHYIFRDPHVARAALLAGGILWRLAIEEVLPDLVFEGPDMVSAQLGIGFHLRDEKSGCIYVDDNLTQGELSNIVGMYFEQHQLGPIDWDNDKYPMWWPLPRYVKGSSLDFPAWTPVAENWYQGLRAKYCQGECGPKQGRDWRTSLRNWDKRSRQVLQASREEMGILLRRTFCD